MRVSVLSYPLDVRFKLLAIGTRINVFDASGTLRMHVKKKKFRLKEDVNVWRDEARTDRVYRLKADRIIDFNATYAVTGPNDEPIGAVRRQGVRSMWHATYDLLDANGDVVGVIREENPWIKLLDGLLGTIPFVSMFINPAYRVSLHGSEVLRVQKQPAFFEGKFTVEVLDKVTDATEDLALPGILMMLILERERG